MNNLQQFLSEDEKMIQSMARQFAEGEVEPLSERTDREHRFPEELRPKLAELGFWGIVIPEEYGGAEISPVAYSLIVEEVARACASTSVIFCAHNSLCAWPIVEFGTEEQKKRYLPKLASGEWLGCFALSEPDTGSDAASLRCTYREDGDSYVISGAKNWITNAPVSDVCVVLATSDLNAGYKGVSAFIVELNSDNGISIGKKEGKLGICGSPTASIVFEETRIPKDRLLSAEGKGFGVAMKTLDGGRIGIGSQATGIAQCALDEALSYSLQRKTFGVEIARHQSIQNYLADMSTRIEAGRLLTFQAAKLKEQGEDYTRAAAQAKLYCSEVSVWAALKCIQIHGGYGYVREFKAERLLRDAKITEIYEGTSEIQRLVIAGNLIKESQASK